MEYVKLLKKVLFVFATMVFLGRTVKVTLHLIDYKFKVWLIMTCVVVLMPITAATDCSSLLKAFLSSNFVS